MVHQVLHVVGRGRANEDNVVVVGRLARYVLACVGRVPIHRGLERQRGRGAVRIANKLLQMRVSRLGFGVDGVGSLDGEHHTGDRGGGQAVNRQGGDTVSQGSAVNLTSHVSRVRQRPHTIILVPVSHTRATNHALTILLFDLSGILEQTFQAVDQRTHRDRIRLNEAATVFRGSALVQLGAGSRGDNQIGQGRTSGSCDVPRCLGAVGNEVRFDSRDEAGNSRLNVLAGQVIESAVVVNRLNQLLHVETHVHAVQRSHGHGLRAFVLLLHRHCVTNAAGVLVRVLDAQGGAVRGAATVEFEIFVVLTVNGRDELQLFVRDAERFFRYQIGYLKNVRHDNSLEGVTASWRRVAFAGIPQIRRSSCR